LLDAQKYEMEKDIYIVSKTGTEQVWEQTFYTSGPMTGFVVFNLPTGE